MATLPRITVERRHAAMGLVQGSVWALRDQAFPLVTKRLMAEVVRWPDEPEAKPQIIASIPACDEASVPRLPKVNGRIGVIPIRGVIGQHRGGDYWSDVSTDLIGAQLATLLDSPAIGAVVLDIDSPGGIVYGTPELGDTIRAAREVKPIYALANGMAASGAYWLGAQATKFYATQSSEVGSIGVWRAHADMSKFYEDAGLKITLVSAGEYKTEANPYEPLTDAGKADMQASVDRYNDMFLAAVAAGRGTTKATVRDTYGRGRVVGAQMAKAAGMIDGIATLSELLVGIMKPQKVGSRLATAAAAIAMEEARR